MLNRYINYEMNIEGKLTIQKKQPSINNICMYVCVIWIKRHNSMCNKSIRITSPLIIWKKLTHLVSYDIKLWANKNTCTYTTMIEHVYTKHTHKTLTHNKTACWWFVCGFNMELSRHSIIKLPQNKRTLKQKAHTCTHTFEHVNWAAHERCEPHTAGKCRRSVCPSNHTNEWLLRNGTLALHCTFFGMCPTAPNIDAKWTHT